VCGGKERWNTRRLANTLAAIATDKDGKLKTIRSNPLRTTPDRPMNKLKPNPPAPNPFHLRVATAYGPDAFNGVAYSPNGRIIAAASNNGTIRLWDVQTGKLLRSLEGHTIWVWSVAFSPDGLLLASGSGDRSVKLWEVASGKLLRSLEGHTNWVESVAFSPDGLLLASGSIEPSVKVWEVARGIELSTYLKLPASHSIHAIQFSPPSTMAASFGKTKLGERDILIHLTKVKPLAAKSHPVASYTSAKVVVIGESSVGKSCLSLRLVTDEYQELGTTHGMRTWEMTPQQLDPAAVPPPHEERKVFLWDLGGQQEYRLVHQLFLPETTLALLLFDPTRGQSAFDDVREWNLRLKKQTERPGSQSQTVKLLVGTKLDTGEEVVDRAAIQQLLVECGCTAYLETSAKAPRGLAELGQAILNRINWDDLSKTTRPRLFQLIRDLVTAHQQHGEVVLLYDELEKQVRAAAEKEAGLEFEAGSVNTVIQQLAGQGQIVETRLSGGERVLVLQIGFISLYAGSLVLAARDNQRGVPVLEELQVVSGRQPLPGLKAAERVDPIRERIVLECTVQLMLDRGLCFRHEGTLIFPTEFKRLEAPDGERRARTVTIYYDFTGAIDNIWASLVTQLALSEDSDKGFGRIRLWKDHAEFEKPGQGVCGLRKVDRQSGLAHLDLLFSDTVTAKTRDLFASFVDEHLRKVGVTIEEGLKLVCPNEHSFNEDDVKARIAAGKTDIGCATCDARVRIGKGDEAASAATARELVALKTDIQRHKRQEISELKREFKPIEVFISYSHRDEVLREELGKHLSALRRENVIGMWHDRLIGAGTEWAGEIDRHLETAGVILLLISPDFIASDYCYSLETQRALERHAAGEAVVIPIVLRPTDWLTLDIAKLQSLPRDNRAVDSSHWKNRDEAFVEVAKGIRQAVEQLLRPSLVAEAAANAAPQFLPQQPQRPPLRILHLSDLHFGVNDDPLVRLQPLLSDLRDRKEGFGLDALDYLVITGDLTNRGAYEEFEQVHDFLSELVKAMKLTAERTLIVPGNHDLSWDEEVYEWVQGRRVELSKLPSDSYVKEGKGYLVRDDARYPKRFTNFARFHHEFKQLEYALKPEAQVLSQLFHETGLQFLAFNSAWRIDEFHPHRSSINEKALAKGLLEADQQLVDAKRAKLLPDDATVLRIALWHHPVTGNEKINDDDFIERLRKADVRLCLHGHVHENREDLIGYLHPTRKLYVAGAGSFGAVAADRPPATPKLYNLIEIPRDLGLIRVHTRCMTKEGGAWRAWPMYPGNQSSYEIKQ
jgi:GTPase SAR1 family protein/predicted MPP superfamily phosphohydrolase